MLRYSSTGNDIASSVASTYRKAFLPPLAETLFTSAKAPIGLTPEGRTVKWMRNVQMGITYLSAKAGEILGSFPAAIVRDISEVLFNSPSVIVQRAATLLLACKLFPNNFALMVLFYNYFYSSSCPPTARETKIDVHDGTIEGFAYASGLLGAVIGSVTSSIIVPPVTGAINVVEYLTKKH